MNRMQTADFSKTKKDPTRAPSNRYVDIQDHQKFEEAKQNRKEFLQRYGTINPKGSNVDSIQSLGQIPEGGYIKSRGQNPNMEHQYISYDTYDFNPNYDNNSVSHKNPNENSTISHENDDKLETLLDRLEESRLGDRALTTREKNMLLEETQYLAMLNGSETLYKIFQLMSNAQENYK